jgi:two-component system, chemotaxis family, chemotaxis protein CheY
MRALIVDDSKAMRMILRRALSECGFADFAEAADGRQGLDALQGSSPCPDVAFVDWNMPVMSGIEFVQAVRAEPAYDGMAVIMVTSETATENVEAALDAGADEYVMKPFTPDVVAEKLALARSARG